MGSLISSPTGNGPRSILESLQPNPLEGNESACAEPEPDSVFFVTILDAIMIPLSVCACVSLATVRLYVNVHSDATEPAPVTRRASRVRGHSLTVTAASSGREEPDLALGSLNHSRVPPRGVLSPSKQASSSTVLPQNRDGVSRNQVAAFGADVPDQQSVNPPTRLLSGQNFSPSAPSPHTDTQQLLPVAQPNNNNNTKIRRRTVLVIIMLLSLPLLSYFIVILLYVIILYYCYRCCFYYFIILYPD